MATRSIAGIFNDAALSQAEKAAQIAFAASGDTQRAGEYAKLKSDTGDKLDSLKQELEPMHAATLLAQVESIVERIMEDGLAEGESDDHAGNLRDLDEQAAHQRSALLDVQAELAPVEAAFTLMQAAEKTMIGMANGAREETRLALITIGNMKKEFAKLENKQQDVSDAIGMAWNMLHDMRDHHQRENDKIELREYLDGGLSTEKPLPAPAVARFRR